MDGIHVPSHQVGLFERTRWLEGSSCIAGFPGTKLFLENSVVLPNGKFGCRGAVAQLVER